MRTKKIATFGAVAALSCGLVGGFTTIPAAFATNSLPGNSVSTSVPGNSDHSHSDEAKISFPNEWKEGQELTFQGSGYTTEDGSAGSTLVLKDHEGSIVGTYDADAQGNVSGNIKWNAAYAERDYVEITVLTGKKAGDVRRSETVKVKVVASEKSGSLPGEGGQGGMGAVGGGSTPSSTPTVTPSSTPEATTPASTPSASTTAEAASTPSAAATETAQVTNGSETHQFATCEEAKEAGFKDIQRSDAAYAEHLDRDNDGVACESNGGNGEQGSASNGNGGAGYVSDNNGGSNNASSNSNGKLANTGANGALTVAGLGMVALGVGGATVAALRKRKRA